ncbi:MAG TPA: hypothetical protein DCZ10_16435 [Pelotomaculum sp.]|nr:hypothetical protein [Pelotomaculum sp.]
MMAIRWAVYPSVWFANCKSGAHLLKICSLQKTVFVQTDFHAVEMNRRQRGKSRCRWFYKRKNGIRAQ